MNTGSVEEFDGISLIEWTEAVSYTHLDVYKRQLKFTAVRDVFVQNEDGTPSTQLKKRIYDLKCSLHGGIIRCV